MYKPNDGQSSSKHVDVDLKQKVGALLTALKSRTPLSENPDSRKPKAKKNETRRQSKRTGNKSTETPKEVLKEVLGPKTKTNVLVKPLPKPKLLSDIEERSKLRAKRNEEINSRKRQKEEKIERELQRIEEMKLELEERERQQKEKLHQQFREREETEKRYMRELNSLAAEHRRKWLKRFAFRSFTTLRVNAMKNSMKAMKFLEKHSLGFVFKLWRKRTLELIEKEERRAQTVYRGKVMLHIFNNWKKIHKSGVQSLQVAADAFDLRLLKQTFKQWRCFTFQQKMENNCKIVKSRLFHQRKMLSISLQSWRNLQMIKRIEEEKMKHKELLRNKVKSFLKDFDT